MWIRSNRSNLLLFSTFSEDREGEPYALFGGKNQKAPVEVILNLSSVLSSAVQMVAATITTLTQ